MIKFTRFPCRRLKPDLIEARRNLSVLKALDWLKSIGSMRRNRFLDRREISDAVFWKFELIFIHLYACAVSLLRSIKSFAKHVEREYSVG
jgi:hypothetical protein